MKRADLVVLPIQPYNPKNIDSGVLICDCGTWPFDLRHVTLATCVLIVGFLCLVDLGADTGHMGDMQQTLGKVQSIMGSPGGRTRQLWSC